jgi:CcmD family protein
MMLRRLLILLVLGFTFLSMGAEGLAAQGSQTISGMRDFWHVFIAFGIAWVLVFGWAVAIFRRLGRLETQLKELDAERSASPSGESGTST